MDKTTDQIVQAAKVTLQMATVVEYINKMRESYFRTMDFAVLDVIVVENKGKWAKLCVWNIKTRCVTSVYGWVALHDNSTQTLGEVKAGDIHKAASFKAPAKTARGNVFLSSTWSCFEPHGIKYL